MCLEALDMERSHGEEWVEGKCRKDKGHYLWYRPGPLSEFRLIPMRCLSYKSRQQHSSTAMAANFGCIRNVGGYRDWHPCAQCMGNARPIDSRSQSEVQVAPDKLEEVASFCYLGNMLSADGGCEITVTTRVKTAWKKFRELLTVLASCHLSYKTPGHVYSSCVRSHDQTDLKYQARGCSHSKVKRATGKAWAWGPQPFF